MSDLARRIIQRLPDTDRWRCVIILLGMGIAGFLLARPAISAPSLTDLLGRFEPESLPTLAPQTVWFADDVGDPPAARRAEWAKLVFQLVRLSDSVLQSRLAASSHPPVVGDAAAINGRIVRLRELDVPGQLSDLLELERLSLVELQTDVRTELVLAKALPSGAGPGDRVEGIGVLLSSDTRTPRDPVRTIAAGRLRWITAQPASPVARMLSEAGIDQQQLDDVAERQRKPLSSSDSATFFKLIGLASQLGIEPAANDLRSAATLVQPVDLLKAPDSWTGQWITIDAETVRWTRVNVESPARRKEVGSPYYYQIDAIGELGNVELRINLPDGRSVTMENRYPVTLVSRTLPAYLMPTHDAATETVSHTVSTSIRVHGFFYRLWSYESEFMQAQGGGEQFAPLVVVGVWQDRSPASSDPVGVAWIGWLAAGGVLLAMAGGLVYALVTRRADRSARQHRAAKHAVQDPLADNHAG